MAEDKNFSDFQEDFCEERQQITFKEKKICPTCIPNPNYILEKNWFEMEEGWLDESECRYKIRVSRNKVQDFLRSRSPDEPLVEGIPTQQEIIRYGIRRLLVQHNKLEANETVCAFGGCTSSFQGIQEFQSAIYEYKQKLSAYSATESTQALSAVGGLGAALLTVVGIGGGWAVFGAVALAGIIIDSVAAAQLASDRNETFSDEQMNEVGMFLRSYLGNDLSEKLDKLQALYPLIHPYALEWSAEYEGSYKPDHDGMYYLVSVSAEDFNVIPSVSDIAAEDETEVNAQSLSDILLDGPTFVDDFAKLNFALHGFEFFYSAFQHVEKVVIYQADEPSVKLNYTNTISTMTQFKKDLNNVLKSNGFQRLNIAADFFTSKDIVKKVKFRFDTTDELPFNLSKDENDQLEIYVLGGDCPDYILLEGADDLNNSKYNVVYGFLSRLDEIMSDLNAQETRQWLEFTLDYFYPTYTADYGLNSGEATEEQKNALLCFLEQELGFGDGKLIDSITESVLSAFDILKEELKKNACRTFEQKAEGTHWEKIETSEPYDREIRKKEQAEEMKKRFSNRIYDDRITEELNNLKTNEQWMASPPAQRGESPSIADIERYTNQKLADIKVQSQIEGGQQWDKNKAKGGEGKRINNSLWIDDATNAWNETFEQDALLIQGLQKTFEGGTRPTSDEVFDFVSAIGICGMSKISEKAIECLLAGMTLNDALELIVEKLIESLDLRFFVNLLTASIPAGIRAEINEIISAEFGDIDLIELLTLKKEEGNFTVGDIIGADRALIKDAYKQILAGPLANEEDKKRFAFALGTSRRWHQNIGAAVPRRDSNGKITPHEDNKKELKKVKRILRRRLKASHGRLLKTSRERYNKIKNSITENVTSLNKSDFIITEGDIKADPTIVNTKYQRTTIGIKIDKLLSFMVMESIDFIKDSLGVDELMKALNNHPISGFVLDTIGALRKDCPSEPLFHPPLKDFMKTFSLDICDPTISLTVPRIIVPSINWRFQIKAAIQKAFTKALENLLSTLLEKLLLKTLSLLEGILCKSLEVVGGLAADAFKGDLSDNSFLNALDKAFCGGGDDQEKAKQLAKQLLGLGGDPSEISQEMSFDIDIVLKAVSDTGTTEDFLCALVCDPGDQNPQFNAAVAAAISDVSDSFGEILGNPSQVGFFFTNLGSNLSRDEKDRIKDLLNAGIPNLPISKAICLTDDELDAYDNFRNQQLQNQGLSPQEAQQQIDNLNQQALDALSDLLDLASSLQNPMGPLGNELMRGIGRPGYPGAPPDDQNHLPDSDRRSPSGDPDDGSAVDNVYDDQEPCQDVVPNPLTETYDTQMSDALANFKNSEYETVENLIIREITDKDGVIGQALADTAGNNLKKHARRTKLHFLYANYANTEEEHTAKFADAGTFLGFLESDPVGVFPNTVGLYLKEQLEDPADVNLDSVYSIETVYNMPTVIPDLLPITVPSEDFIIQDGNIELLYEEGESAEITNFKFNLSTTFRGDNFDSLGYHVGIWETYQMSAVRYTYPMIMFSKHYNLDFDENEREYISNNDLGLDYHNDVTYLDFREETFKKYLKNTAKQNVLNEVLDSSLKSLYENIFNKTMKGVIETVLTDPDGENDGHPQGFLFGYQSDTLLPEDFEYTAGDNESQTLGSFGNSRIVPLSPETYGGIGISYENPPYTVSPVEHNGWVEISNATMPGPEGCEPKKPSALKLDDIRDRVKKLTKSIPIDPRLSKDPDCIEEIPFNIILDSTFKANLDGNVRTTIRMFASEYLLRGMGPISNLEYNSNNYNNLLADYIVSEMKKSMMEQGSIRSSRKIRIKRKNYWYTFLEQAAECYQRMIDIEGIVPPEYLQADLDKIQDCRDYYRYPNKRLRRKYFNKGDYKQFNCPGRELEVEDLKDNNFMNWAIAYRLYGENIFKSPDPVQINNKRWILLKKIRFFSKILAIRTVEKHAMSILSELVQSEIRILMKKFKNRISDESKIFDLNKYFLGMGNIFDNTSSKIGLTDYYLKKQTNSADPGNVSDVMPDNSAMSYPHSTDDIIMVVEKYLRIRDKNDITLPSNFLNRNTDLKGAIPLNKFEEIFSALSEEEKLDKKLSDFFGNLQFTYQDSLRDVITRMSGEGMSRTGWTTSQFALLEKIISLNKEKEEEIRSAFKSLMVRGRTEDVSIVITEDLLPQGVTRPPSGVVGDLGVFYGLRICVSPNPAAEAYSTISAEIPQDDTSELEKAYRFQDGNLLIPLVSAEIEVKDGLLSEFNAPGGYDLECMVDKMTSSADFSILFDKIFPLRLFSSLTALYCSHGFPYSLGQGTDERDPDVDVDPENLEFDRSFMKRTKRHLRSDFQSNYLARTLDGDADEDDDDSRRELFKLSNPFADINLSPNFIRGLGWFQRRRLVSNPYDANGIECASPLKDLF